ncbi:MAG: glycine cleavage system H protein [Anaerolineales bacterium]|jgi:glycine cleavage system H protein|nr:glycine cleavage system H protein [Anaerolineales bacterium]
MSNTPSSLKYAKSDEWFDPATGKVGISDYAQAQLSDIVFMEITVSVGDQVEAGGQIASVESVKAASEVSAPVSGKIVAINEDLASGPEAINGEPYQSWFVQIEGGDGADMLDAAGYEKHCEERAH